MFKFFIVLSMNNFTLGSTFQWPEGNLARVDAFRSACLVDIFYTTLLTVGRISIHLVGRREGTSTCLKGAIPARFQFDFYQCPCSGYMDVSQRCHQMSFSLRFGFVFWSFSVPRPYREWGFHDRIIFAMGML
jgi:hypothetical protein